jgi:hypothetical protein
MYNIEVVNTYPQTVTCTVYIKSPSGGPMPGPQLTLLSNTLQGASAGEVLYVEITYPPPSGGPTQTISIPYGAPIDPTKRVGVLWNTSPTTQVVVIVETAAEGNS